MRTLTIKSGSTGTDYNTGWHELLVSKAEYGEWNGSKCIDVYFDGYPENFNMRVYAKTGTDGEEFAIGQLYRFANAGITSGLEGPDGTKVIKMDDSAEALIGKKMNVYFYKDGKYSRILSKTAPYPFENAVESFNSSDVDYWKGRAMAFYEKYVEPKLNEKSEAPLVSASSESDDNIPF